MPGPRGGRTGLRKALGEGPVAGTWLPPRGQGGHRPAAWSGEVACGLAPAALPPAPPGSRRLDPPWGRVDLPSVAFG